MDDKICFTMKIMLLMSIKNGTVAPAWEDEKVWFEGDG